MVSMVLLGLLFWVSCVFLLCFFQFILGVVVCFASITAK